MEMNLRVASDKRFCNLIEFFWPVQGKTTLDVYNTTINAYGLMGAGAVYLNTSAVIKSIDGASIGCYELWRKDTDFDALSATVLAPVVESLEAVASYDFYLTDVIAGGSKFGSPQFFSIGKVFYIAEFPLVKAFEQSYFSDIKAFFEKQLLQVPELISYSVSRATDDSRFVIIEEWESVAAAERLAMALSNLPDSPLNGQIPAKCSNIFENVHIHHNNEPPAIAGDVQSSALPSNIPLPTAAT